MAFSAAVSLVAGILGIAGIVGAALSVLLAGRSKGTIDVLKADNDALRDRMDTLEAIEDACQKRLDELERTNVILTETVTSAAKVAALETRLDEHHAEVVRRLDALAVAR